MSRDSDYAFRKRPPVRFDLGGPPAFTGWRLGPASTHSLPATVRLVWKTRVGRGSLDGGGAPIADKGTVIVPSGYGFAAKLPGNVLQAYRVTK